VREMQRHDAIMECCACRVRNANKLKRHSNVLSLRPRRTVLITIVCKRKRIAKAVLYLRLIPLF